jgi:hypothetical protein
MIRDFIAIDFETANQESSSVCSIGVVMVRNGQVADSSAIRCPIISSTLLQTPAATTSRIIIMPWPMLKPVPL